MAVLTIRMWLFYGENKGDKEINVKDIEKANALAGLKITIDLVLIITSLLLGLLAALNCFCRRWEKLAELVTIAFMLAPALL